MPIGFAKSIITTDGANVANTQAASWSIVSGAVDFDGFTPAHFGTHGMKTLISSSGVDNCDSTITLYPSDTNFRFNSNFAYTIEFFIKFTNTNTYPQSHDLFEIALEGEGLDHTTNNYGKLTANGSSVFFAATTNDSTLARSQFGTDYKHMAITSDGSGTQNLYFNGQRQLDDDNYTYTGNAKGIAIGNRGTRNSSSPSVVYDEIRVSNIERYTGTSFTVPTSAFTPDENTIALFHCDNNKLDSSRG